MSVYTKNQFMVIVCLYQNDCTNTFKSFTVNKLADGIKLDNSNKHLSINTIRNAIKLFIDLGYIAKGLSDCNAITYYLTEKGVNEYKKLLG